LTSLAVSAGVTRQARIIEDIIFSTKIIETGAILNDRVSFLRIEFIGIVVIEIGGQEEHDQHRHIQSHLREREGGVREERRKVSSQTAKNVEMRVPWQ
jgi:hypothetical protein